MTFLPLLSSLVQTKLVCFPLNFLPLIMGRRNVIFLLEIKSIFALVFKMSWYEITKKVQGTRNKKIDESKKRIFRVAIMSCACLLMNTAATVSLSVVLEDWSVSSNQWLTCTVLETFVTRNWTNYGLYIGDRYFLFWFLTERYLLVTVLIDCCCFDYQPSRI